MALVRTNHLSDHTSAIAHLATKDGIYHADFDSVAGSKKSLKTHDERAVKAAIHIVEITLHHLLTGQIQLPELVDAGNFIVSEVSEGTCSSRFNLSRTRQRYPAPRL